MWHFWMLYTAYIQEFGLIAPFWRNIFPEVCMTFRTKSHPQLVAVASHFCRVYIVLWHTTWSARVIIGPIQAIFLLPSSVRLASCIWTLLKTPCSLGEQNCYSRLLSFRHSKIWLSKPPETQTYVLNETSYSLFIHLGTVAGTVSWPSAISQHDQLKCLCKKQYHLPLTW